MSRIRGEPPPARRDLDTSTRQYAEAAESTLKLIDNLLGRFRPQDGKVNISASLLAAMRETHESMRAIFRAAEIADGSGTNSGQYVDAMLLARPQVETVFVGLLMLHDPDKYLWQYRRAAWVAGVRSCHYEYLRLAGTPAGDAWWQNQREVFQRMAVDLQITAAEEMAALSDLRGQTLTEDERRGQIRSLPDPSEITHEKRRLLAGGPFESLGDLLWREWKARCDPTHIGLRGVSLRSVLRGDPADVLTPTTRDDLISQEVVVKSIVVSLVSMLSLATAVVVARFPSEISLVDLAAKAWDPWKDATVFGSIIWDGWARRALGILDAE